MRANRQGGIEVLNNREEYSRCLIPILQITEQKRKPSFTEELREEALERVFRERPDKKHPVAKKKKGRPSKKQKI